MKPKSYWMLAWLLLSLGSSAQSVLPASYGGVTGAAPADARSLPSRSNRHALIVTISRYANPATSELPGARIDQQSATQMAQAMQVPIDNISYLKDEQATGDGIREALRQLTDRVQEGDRVYIHYSGHGTRNEDASSGGCVEALMAYDGGQGGTITNHELADRLKAITTKTDKLFVMIDACHSGGVVQAASATRTRSLTNDEDEGMLRAKFTGISEECGRPVNIKTRSLLTETSAKGVFPQDIIHVSASRHNEISFDDERKGGLATQYVRDCMLRDAKDLDNSGAISMEEIRQCAQEKLNRRLAKDPNFKAHNLVLNGNGGFVPAWFGMENAVPAATGFAPLTGEQELRQMFDQRDAKRRVQVKAGKDKLKIGLDVLDLNVLTDRSGYVYVAMAGSDNKSVYLLFPNDLDANNKIEAGQQFQLPRPNWRVKASGPEGTDNLLVLVADAPRDLSALAQNKAGPFLTSLNDVKGRAQLGALMSMSKMGGSSVCSQSPSGAKNPLCSDAYGAVMLAVDEVK